MSGFTVRRMLAVALVAMVGATLIGAAPAIAASWPGQAALDRVQAQAERDTVAMPEFPQMVEAFATVHPMVPRGEATRGVAGQARRVALADELAARYPHAYGGSWYDSTTSRIRVDTR